MTDRQSYLKRVAPEHKRPKFMKWLDTNLNVLDGITDILNSMDSCFDLDNAVGVQLDIVGSIIGRERRLSFEPPLNVSPVLDDSLYRILQRAKISINQWDGTIPGMYSLWKNLFPEFEIVVEDNQDMSMNVYIVGDTLPLERELMSQGYIAPKPQGVWINYKFILPKYSFEENLYIGSAITTDYSQMNIPTKMLSDVVIYNAPLHTGIGIGEYSKTNIPTKTPEQIV